MTNEEMEKAIEFIFAQQASATAKIDAVAEAQMHAEERWTRTEESIRALLSIAEIHKREIQANSQQILSLGEQTRATDEPLNALINVVERHITGGRNGNA